jgi:PPOX class probable F420-dependent enzyme
MDWEEVVAFLKGAPIAHLGTSSPDGEPHVSVVSPGVEGDALWFATTATSRKARNLQANPRVALVWQPQAEIYLRGSATIVTGEAEKQRLWESGLFAFDLAAFWGTPANPALVFVKVQPVSAMVLSIGAEGLTQQRWRRPS